MGGEQHGAMAGQVRHSAQHRIEATDKLRKKDEKYLRRYFKSQNQY
jgi:hypothetical protein